MQTINVIYLYTNLINGKQYVGQSVDFKNRHRRHIAGYDKDHSLIDKAIVKYGIDNFSVRILEAVPHLKGQFLKNYLNKLEVFYIDKLKPEYNQTKGGDYNPMYDPVIRRKHREMMTGDNNPMKKWENRVKFMGENNPMKRPEIVAKFKGIENPSKREDVKRLISMKKSSTGIYRLRKKVNKQCVQGFTWYYLTEDKKTISSTSLSKLIDKLNAKGIELVILDEEKAKNTFEGGGIQWQT